MSLRADGETAITGLPLNIQLKVQEAAASQDVIDDGKNIAGADYYLDSTTYNAQVAESCTITMDSNKEVTVANTYKPYSTVTVTKSVLGEMGSYEDWFNFSVTKTDGEVVDVDKDTDETTTEEGYAFRLQNGDTVILINLKPGDVIQLFEQTSASGYKIDDNNTRVHIYGLSNGDAYTVTENAANSDGYVTTIDGSSTENGVKSGSFANSNVTVAYTNTRDAVSPTGLIMDIAPYVLLVVVAAAGCFVFLRKRRED